MYLEETQHIMLLSLVLNLLQTAYSFKLFEFIRFNKELTFSFNPHLKILNEIFLSLK